MFKVGDKVRNVKNRFRTGRVVGRSVSDLHIFRIDWGDGRITSEKLVDIDDIEGPVRTVTRREIVPGVYGPVKIGEISTGVSIGTDAMVFVEKLEISLIGEKFTKSDVDEMIHVLTQIRGAM